MIKSIVLFLVTIAMTLRADAIIYKSEIPVHAATDIKINESGSFEFKYGPYRCYLLFTLRTAPGLKERGIFNPSQITCEAYDNIYQTQGAYSGYIANRFKEGEIYLEKGSYVSKGSLFYVIVTSDMTLMPLAE
jgi:hypothetical protein